MITEIQQKLKALKASTCFVDHRAAYDCIEELDALRTQIAEDLSKQSVSTAIECLERFLELHDELMNRIHDDNGDLSYVFLQACKDLGMLYKKAKYPASVVVDLVFKQFMEDEYCTYQEIIPEFKPILGTEGLKALQTKLLKASSIDQTATQAALGLESIKAALNSSKNAKKDMKRIETAKPSIN